MLSKSIIIIGAGPCGLGAAWRLKEHGFGDFLVVEEKDFAGGLAASLKDNHDFIWDMGGHVTYSHYRYFNRFYRSIMRSSSIQHRRSAWLYMFQRYIPFPCQYNIHFLPKKIYQQCLAGLKREDKKAKPENYKEWIYSNYGEGFARYFQIPYAEKLWSYPPEEMNFSWVGERVAPGGRKRILKNIKKSKSGQSWGPNFYFKYPLQGGNGEIWKRTADRLKEKIVFSKKVIKIDGQRRILTLNDGSCLKYNQLLATMPIDLLLEILRGISPPKLKKTLKYSSAYLVGVGIKGKIPLGLVDKHWIYYPEKEIPFFRVTLLSNLAPSLVPEKHWSILTETSCPINSSINSKKLEKKVIDSLAQLGFFADFKNICSLWSNSILKAYPIPTLERDDFLNKTTPFLENYDLYSRGRFGFWKYEVGNQDHTFMQGVEWVDRIISGKKELTINNPNLVNIKAIL